MAWLKRDRYWGGWREFRYGAKSIKAKAAISGLKEDDRRRATHTVLEFMQRWRSSPFENEGAVIAALRSEMCLRGYPWDTADREAHTVVETVLRTLGARRPRWEEGQPEYSEPRENCKWCRVDLPDDLSRGGSSIMYCSEVCAKSAITHRVEAGKVITDQAYRIGYEAIRKIRSIARPCENCGAMFRSRFADQKTCSVDCRAEALVTLPPRSCDQCGTSFRPAKADSKFCSVSCSADAKRTVEHVAACEHCGEVFRARRSFSKFCSIACAGAAKSKAIECTCEQCGTAFALKNRGPKEMLSGRGKYCGQECYSLARRTRRFDCTCSFCSNGFQSGSATARYCSPFCDYAGRRLIKDGKLPAKISAPVFDHLFGASRRAPSKLVLTAKIFDDWFEVAA